MDRRWRTRLVGFSLQAFIATLAAGTVTAHEVAGSRFDAPLPLSLLFGGAAATVGLTALWLATTDRKVPPTSTRELLSIPPGVATGLSTVLRYSFLLAFVAVLVEGIAGEQVAAENVATVFAWGVWVPGVALLSILGGSPWPVLSPWRTLYEWLVALEGEQIAILDRDPGQLANGVSLFGFLALVILENLTVASQSPRLTSMLLGGYALAMVGGAVCFGDAWLRRADPLSVLYRLFGRVAVFQVVDRDDRIALWLKPPWRDTLGAVGNLTLVSFVVAMVYSVSFDGFTDTRTYQELLFGTRALLGTGTMTSVLLFAVGLGIFIGTFFLATRLVERLGTSAADGGSWQLTARRFAPSVLPIAAAYEVAHNYPYVFESLGRLVAIVVRPFFPGVDAFEPLGWLSLPAFWGSQVALIVVGHVVAVVAAHYVAVDRYGSLAAARRAHLPLVIVMLGYTVLSLWIISQPVVA